MSKRKSEESPQYIACCNLVKVFKEAKRQVKVGRYGNICNAINFGVWQKYGINSHWPIIEARIILRDRLGGHFSLEDWLRANCNGYDDLLQENPDLVKKCLRRTRLAWLDSLVAEFEAKAKKELKRGKRKS